MDISKQDIENPILWIAVNYIFKQLLLPKSTHEWSCHGDSDEAPSEWPACQEIKINIQHWCDDISHGD